MPRQARSAKHFRLRNNDIPLHCPRTKECVCPFFSFSLSMPPPPRSVLLPLLFCFFVFLCYLPPHSDMTLLSFWIMYGLILIAACIAGAYVIIYYTVETDSFGVIGGQSPSSDMSHEQLMSILRTPSAQLYIARLNAQEQLNREQQAQRAQMRGIPQRFPSAAPACVAPAA